MEPEVAELNARLDKQHPTSIARLMSRVCVDGKPAHGSISRIAGALRVSHETVRKYFSGEWTPGARTNRKIESILSDKRFDFSARKPGPKS